MLAEVYPIKRLPRRFRTLAYAIPSGMAVGRGSVVKIPFRTGTVFGVVASIRAEEASDRTFFAKPMASLFPSLAFSPAEVSWFEALAQDMVQSVPSLLHASLPAFPKREKAAARKTFEGRPLTIPADEVAALSEATAQMAALSRAFLFSPDLRRSAAIISAYRKLRPDIPIQVIAPHVRDAELLRASLAHLSPFFLTGEETPLKRFRTWAAYRESANGILIGSRLAALLPHPSLGAVFLIRSSHQDQKQADQNPRYNARLASELLSRHLKASLYFLDAAPRTDDLLLFPEAQFLRPLSLPNPTVADLAKERLVSPHPILTSTAMQAILETFGQGKRVLCIFNKRGADQKSVINILRRLFPKNTVAGLDKEIGATEETKRADILVATHYYLESVFDPFSPELFGLVLVLQADLPLFSQTCRSLEQALGSLAEWQGAAFAMRAGFAFQTESAALLTPFFDRPLAMLKKDLEQRADYQEPPCCRYLTLQAKEADPDGIARIRAQILRERPDAIIAEEQGGLTIRLHPQAFDALHTLFSRIPDRFIIDTTAHS